MCSRVSHACLYKYVYAYVFIDKMRMRENEDNYTRPIRLMTSNSHCYYRIECPSVFYVVISLEFYI